MAVTTHPGWRAPGSGLRRLAALLFALLAIALPAQAITPVETARIEALIAHVAALPGATVIRNGEPHPAAEAADHLRMKWQKVGKRVQTAEDFVRLCASESYLSGKPYLIRFADGRTVEAGPYLRQRLQALPAR